MYGGRGEKVAFPASYKSGVLYNVVDGEDLKEVHEQYTSREAIEAAKAGKLLPSGTVITAVAYKALLDPPQEMPKGVCWRVSCCALA